MKKYFYLLAIFCITTFGCHAENRTFTTVGQDDNSSTPTGEFINSITPSYTDYILTDSWGSNWFFETKLGTSAFVGSPVGCGDIFNRIMPTVQVGVGKWFTPTIGGRINFQGFKFKNAKLQKMRYQFVHADFLWNITGKYFQDENGISKWDVIPFIGVGIIHNSDWTGTCKCPGSIKGCHSFAFSYGLELRYHIYRRLHIIAELSGMTTLKSFDAINMSNQFGDNMMNASLGLSFSIGKQGWQRAVDAAPYIRQNDILNNYINNLNKKESSDEQNLNNINEKKSYMGLEMLKARLLMQKEMQELEADKTLSSTDSINKGDSILKVPVYFFFQKGKVKLTDPSQLVNLDNIAKAVKEHNLSIRIDGAADKATGNRKLNRKLSIGRANYVAKELVKRGVDKKSIKRVAHGGVNFHKKPRENRYACVSLNSEE